MEIINTFKQSTILFYNTLFKCNLYRDTEHDYTIMTEQKIPSYWLYEKLVRLNMYWVVLHVCCLNLTMFLKQPIHAPY